MKLKVRNFMFPFLASLAVLPAMTGCNKTADYDEKTTIFLEPYSASGFGYEWINDLANEWKQQTQYTGYEIVVDPSSTALAKAQLNSIEAGTTNTDIYFGGAPEYKEGIYKGYFEDLTDMLSVSPDNNGVTIQDKIVDWNIWKDTASKISWNNDTQQFDFEGFYMLPYTVTMSGMIFDYDTFLQYGYLTKATNDKATRDALTNQGISFEEKGTTLKFVSSTSKTNYEVGEIITTPGKDGKYGTYDDGQPTNMTEFEAMINKISARGKPFIYSQQGMYLDATILAIASQKGGMDFYNAITHFNSNGKAINLYDGGSEIINWENGYQVYKADCITDGVTNVSNWFFNSELCSKTNYVSDAQDKFINSIIGNGDFYGIINEGNWFEFEAAESFKSAKKKGGKGFGEYDLRFMLPPDMDDQKGIDGEGHGSCISAPEYGAIVVRKQQYAEKLAAIKDFLSFVLKADSLKKTTMKNGLLMGYKYPEFSNEDYQSMTIFQRNCLEMFYDQENVKVLKQRTDKLAAPFTYASKSILSTEEVLYAGTMTPCNAMINGQKPAAILNSIRGCYSKALWDTIYEEVKKATAK